MHRKSSENVELLNFVIPVTDSARPNWEE